jgi:type IV secretory pathway TraG/TraD family ATPase VirD4
MIEVAANALPHLGETYETRLFFILDELPTLNRIPALLTSLATLRQFGAAFMLGFQVNSQLEDIYGREGALTIAGTLNTVAIFSTPDFQTAEACSKRLGMQDQEEMNESISLGAHTARDGVSVMARRQERAIVTTSEIQSLPQFTAYLQFAYDAPVTQVTLKPSKRPQIAEGFVDAEPVDPSFEDNSETVFVEPFMDDAPLDPLDMAQTFPGAYAMEEGPELVPDEPTLEESVSAGQRAKAPPQEEASPPAPKPAQSKGALKVVGGTDHEADPLAKMRERRTRRAARTPAE